MYIVHINLHYIVSMNVKWSRLRSFVIVNFRSAGVDRAPAEVPLHDDGGRPLLRVRQRGAPRRQRRRRLCRVAALQPRLAPLLGCVALVFFSKRRN